MLKIFFTHSNGENHENNTNKKSCSTSYNWAFHTIFNGTLPQGVRDMATTVSNISHAASAEGKAAMVRIQANDEAPDSAKSLAGIIGGFNHMLNEETKMTLAQLFP